MTFPSAVSGQIFHTDLRSADPAATAAFLHDAFGFAVQDTPHPPYKIFDDSGGFEGHIGPVPGGDAGPSATNYVRVADIAAAEAAVIAAGGRITVARQVAGSNGWYTWFEAPGGIRMVLWQNMPS